MRGNALAQPVTQIGERDRVDVILTNPPFGGEEEKGIQANFPEPTSRRPRPRCCSSSSSCGSCNAGWAAAASSSRTASCSATASARASRSSCSSECNLHTVVRLPDGVFAPYTASRRISCSSTRPGATSEVWFYEIPPPEGRKKYSKTTPMRFEEFAALPGMVEQSARRTSERWRVPVAEIEAYGFNLDLRNPTAPTTSRIGRRPS